MTGWVFCTEEEVPSVISCPYAQSHQTTSMTLCSVRTANALDTAMWEPWLVGQRSIKNVGVNDGR